MNIVDAIIILIILMGAVIGFKNGVIRQTVSLVGFLLVIILAFLLKNPLSLWMYEHLPFFNFWGILKGVTVINILLYEVIAFLILVAIFTTAISAGYSFLVNCTKSKKQYTYWAIIMCITSILVSKLSFSGLINLLYPIFGYLGIIQIIFILNLKKAS